MEAGLYACKARGERLRVVSVVALEDAVLWSAMDRVAPGTWRCTRTGSLAPTTDLTEAAELATSGRGRRSRAVRIPAPVQDALVDGDPGVEGYAVAWLLDRLPAEVRDASPALEVPSGVVVPADYALLTEVTQHLRRLTGGIAAERRREVEVPLAGMAPLVLAVREREAVWVASASCEDAGGTIAETSPCPSAADAAAELVAQVHLVALRLADLGARLSDEAEHDNDERRGTPREAIGLS